MKMRSRPGLSALAWPAFAALVIGCGDNGGREEGTATATVTNSGGSLSQSGSDGSEGSSGPATPTTSGATSSDTTIDPSSMDALAPWFSLCEQVGAFVKLKAGRELTEEAIQEFCRGKISRYKIPQYIFFVDGFPMTASGKIQKYKLRELSLELLEKKGIVVI